jgi:hypothetical protein
MMWKIRRNRYTCDSLVSERGYLRRTTPRYQFRAAASLMCKCAHMPHGQCTVPSLRKRPVPAGYTNFE